MVGVVRIASRLVMIGLLSGAPAVQALAQQSGATPRAAPPRTGTPTLQSEPGDIWADVRAWNDDAARRRAVRAAPPPAQPPRSAPAPKPRRPRN